MLTPSFQKPLPYDGEFFEPQQKKFKETILLTHHYGGHKKQMRRPIEFLNSLGFRAFTFNFYPQPFKGSLDLIKERGFTRVGLYWKKQLEEIFSLLEGPLIWMAFSFSCNLASVMAQGQPRVKALIFDGGPFARPLKNPWLYLTHAEPIQNPLLRAFAILPWNLFFNFFFLKMKIQSSLKKLPPNFPVLSFRCLEDELVPPEIIDDVLSPHQNRLNLERVGIKGASHLQGMKTDPLFYQEHLKKFLIENAKALQ